MNRIQQKGVTLLVAMVMLVVLTLLVVYAIRSSNTNLIIAGNMQVQVEATAVGQQAVDTVIQDVKVDAVNISTYVPAQLNVTVNDKSYSVTPTISTCLLEVPILNSQLSPTNPNDVPCFENPDQDAAVTAAGNMTTRPSACNSQQWEVRAAVTDAVSGVSTSVVQGVSVRAPSTTTCL